MTKETFKGQPQYTLKETILSLASRLKSDNVLRSHPLRRLQTITISEKLEDYAGSILPQLKHDAGLSVSASWLISWATGTNQSLAKPFRNIIGALPLSAVAVPFEMQANRLRPMLLKDLPLGFYKSVTSDRRQLMVSTEDDKKVQCSSWNKALIQDALVNAYIYLLEGIRDNGPSTEYEYYSLWPLECSETELPIKQHFVTKLVQFKSRLFHRDLHWQNFKKSIFLDPSLRNDSNIGEIAFETLLAFYSGGSSVVMELPYHVMTNLEAYYPVEMKNKIVSKEQFFINVFLPNIENMFWRKSERNINNRDKLVISALEFENKAVRAALSSTKCIPSEPNGDLKRPTELVSPLGNLSDLFSYDDGVFPRGQNTFRLGNIIPYLVGLGMMDNYLPLNCLEERCQSVVKLNQTCGQCAIERCSKILKYLNSAYVFHGKLQRNPNELQKLQNITFFPVLKKPLRWHFSWKGNVDKHASKKTCQSGHPSNAIRLASPANLFVQGTETLVGCVKLILDETSISATGLSIRSLDVYKCLGLQGSSKSDVPYKIVFSQLRTVVQEYKEKESKDTAINCQVIVHDIYSFLDIKCANSEDISNECFQEFSKDNTILVGDQIMDASRIVFHLKHNCSPVLLGLENTDLAKYKHLWKAIGIKEHADVEDIAKVLGEKKRQLGSIPLSIKDIDLIHGLLSALKDAMDDKVIKYEDVDKSLLVNIVAPDSDGILRQTSSLCLDDSEFEIGPDTKIVNDKISPSLALALGVTTRRRKCIDDFTCLIPVGQQEKLVTRLRGILSAYPCDDGIMKELLQNADDAQASEIHFIKDFRKHGCGTIFDQKYAPLQGPALCVFNSSAFTQADLQGIHHLGIGSKRDDPLKTGQYGVGFNAVYHLTDAPSFLTKGPDLENGEMLCVFDPTCQYLPKVDEHNPGLQCVVSKIRTNYSDVLSGYLEENVFNANVGTMFRFPLRTKISPETIQISSKQVNEEDINNILEKFCTENFEALLFVKHVSKIIVSNISSGELVEEFRVEVTISEEDKRKRDEFFQVVRDVSDQYKQDSSCINELSSKEVGYTVTLTDGKRRSESFYVVQRIGFKEGFSIPETVVHALKDKKLGQLPLGGVAVVIPNIQQLIEQPKNQKDSCAVIYSKERIESNCNNGRAFCFLPLPTRTGLPCHINGHFALDHEARRSLWKEEKGYRHDWNYSIFKAIVSPAYVSALLFLKQQIFEGNHAWSIDIIYRLLHAFHSQFPLVNLAKDDDWKAFVQYLYSLIIEDKVPVFPVLLESIGNIQSTSGDMKVHID
ncbi:hypothetical protein CHS0354_035543 [Potamilus streckersoni]|uniref:Sacsin/Nov domain-containing protein n=1 Tax=Potamilus streckersoni TaxID=2493646 RepID=A0AAE0RSJ5_9BIVA|nr:hypothetical protein CHS0354_035543 [Potamilus streckersoni]